MSEDNPVPVSRKRVNAFRLSRHHLSKREPSTKMGSVVGDICGAQAQMLPAAQMALWARVKGLTVHHVDSAIWKKHSLVRAWAMRRTMFLLPSNELAVFVRGTTRRAMFHFRHAVSRIGSEQKLNQLLDAVLDTLSEPRSRSDLAKVLSKSHGYKLKSKPGGGWGNKRPIPWIQVGNASLPVGWLLHVIAARDVIVSGQGDGNEATYVRADRWIPHWKDMPVEQAERELLVKYLRAFGPATLADFALWAGMYVRDARVIWEREIGNLAQVNVEGWKTSIEESDLSALETADVDETARLLPYFDSFLLGHKSHSNIVDEKHRKKVYRSQGWISPVLLVNGRADGVWSHTRNRDELEVRVSPFRKLPSAVSSRLRDEAAYLGRFLDSKNVKTVIT